MYRVFLLYSSKGQVAFLSFMIRMSQEFCRDLLDPGKGVQKGRAQENVFILQPFRLRLGLSSMSLFHSPRSQLWRRKQISALRCC